MRTPPRKLRPFRPAALALESISPVSSLAVAMPPTASPAVGQAVARPVRVDQPTRLAPLPSSFAASPSVAPEAISRGVGADGSVVTSTSPVAMPQTPQATQAATVDIGRYANAITIASANVPLVRPSNGSADIPVAGGVGAIGSMASPAAGAPAPTPTPPPVVPATLDTLPTPSSVIRPMTLAATQASKSDSTGEPGSLSSQSMSGFSWVGSSTSAMASTSSSSSSSDSSAPPPSLTASGGGTGATSSSPGVYTMGQIPVGTIMTMNAMPPNGSYTIDTSTIKWTGGTNYSSYLSASAASTPASNNQPTSNIAPGQTFATGSSYVFVVDGDPRQYTVTLSLSYLNPNGGADIAAPNSTLTFTSIAPTVTNINAAQGTSNSAKNPANPPTYGIQLLNTQPPYSNNNPGPGMSITVTTNTTTFGGNFMFLQMTSVLRFTVTAAGVRQYEAPQGAGPAIDNGVNNSVGYPISNPQTEGDPPMVQDNHSWILGPNSSYTATMIDNPQVAEPSGNSSVSIGNFSPPNTNPPTPQTPESFDTYVMYMPTIAGASSSWVALADIHWVWSGMLTTTNPQSFNQIPNLPAPNVTNPLSGAACFPGWTDTATATLSRGWQTYTGP